MNRYNVFCQAGWEYEILNLCNEPKILLLVSGIMPHQNVDNDTN